MKNVRRQLYKGETKNKKKNPPMKTGRRTSQLWEIDKAKTTR